MCGPAPNGIVIIALCCELLYGCGPVGQGAVNLRVPAARRRENDMDAIGSPVGVFVAARAMGELHHIAAGHIHDENIEVSRFISTSPRKRYVLSIGAPRGIDRIPFPSAQAGNVCSVYIHSIYLRRTSAS